MEVYYQEGITARFYEDPFAVVIVTPLMKRASALSHAANSVFVDSTSSCDAENRVITFFLCPCAAGTVPLGIVITKGQNQKSYTLGFSLLKASLQNPFNRNGAPTIFMTDNSSAKTNALQALWPGCQPGIFECPWICRVLFAHIS
ncbi:hypothetical protein JTE90_003349 [Oedothorax gibbosus]|uniref:MULE transposase domain-containing protein n=1 Tax=Oedothorax gibbosus TaxID=931172 RepID=A0AAV6TYU3_9ARAC|nr:hypothetical protein JTE90_003349 [Oedothorax gibbosus]